MLLLIDEGMVYRKNENMADRWSCMQGPDVLFPRKESSITETPSRHLLTRFVAFEKSVDVAYGKSDIVIRRREWESRKMDGNIKN